MEHPGLFDDPFGEDTLLFLPGATRRRRRRRDIDASSLSDLADPAGAPRAGAEDTDWSDRFSPGDTELVLDPITPANDGLYTCTASNEHGRASIQVAVQVLGESVDSVLELVSYQSGEWKIQSKKNQVKEWKI